MERAPAPDVEGLQLIERLPPAETAGRGELWRARSRGGLHGAGRPLPADLRGAGECVVRLLRLPVDPIFRARALVIARDLTAVDDPHIVRVLDVRSAFDGLALVLDAPSLPAVGLDQIGRQRLLAAGELVTVGIAIAWALDALHRCDLTHGDLRDADILVPAGGRPMLSGAGIAAICGAPGEQRDDIRALARVLASLLDHELPGAAELVAALEPARSEQPDTAAAIAVRLAAATPPRPISLHDPDPESDGEIRVEPAAPAPGRHRSRGAAPPAALGGLLTALGGGRIRPWQLVLPMVLLVLAACAAVRWGGAGDTTNAGAPPPGPSSRPPAPMTSPATAWRAVLTGLAAARSAAFAAPSAVSLAAVDAPGSPALRADQRLLGELQRRGISAAGLTLRIDSVAVQGPPLVPDGPAVGAEVTLRVRDRLSGYRLVTGSGRTVQLVAARAAADHLVLLRREAGGWRIAEVRDPSDAVSGSVPTSAPPAAAGAGT